MSVWASSYFSHFPAGSAPLRVNDRRDFIRGDQPVFDSDIDRLEIQRKQRRVNPLLRAKHRGDTDVIVSCVGAD